MKIFSNPPESCVKRLLTDSRLPTEDITANHLKHFFYCGEGEEIDGGPGVFFPKRPDDRCGKDDITDGTQPDDQNFQLAVHN